MSGMQARIRLGSILCLPTLLLFAGSCTPGSNLPASPTPGEESRPVAPSPSLPAADSATATPLVPCTIEAQAGLSAYQRPDLQADVFAEVPAGTNLPALGTTETGWIGFDPGTAQAGNIGPFRLRWLPPGGSYELTGGCQSLPVLPSLPATTCFTMAMDAQPIFAAARLDSNLVSMLNVGEYAGVISRTPDGWLELALVAADVTEPRTGWMQAEYANFNGPCSAFSPPQNAALIEPYAPGTSPLLHSIEMVDSELGWAIAGSEPDDDHLLRTSNGGLTWSDITPPEYASRDGSDRKQLAGSFHANGSAQVAYYNSQAAVAPLVISLWTTGDWGATWQSAGVRKFEDQAEIGPVLSFSPDGQGWLWIEQFVGMGTHAFTLLASNDGGQNYATLLGAQDTNDGCHRSKIARLDQDTGWMSADCPFDNVNSAAAQVTTDGGATWSFLTLPAPRLPSGWSFETSHCAGIDLQLFNRSQVFLLVHCDRTTDQARLAYLYRTEDGGQTWSTQLLPANQFLFLDRERGWALGRQLFWTADGAQSWSAIKTVSWDGIFDFVDANQGWAIARSGEELALVRSADGGKSWVLLEPVIGRP